MAPSNAHATPPIEPDITIIDNLKSQLETIRTERNHFHTLYKKVDDKNHAYLFASIKERITLQHLSRKNEQLESKNLDLQRKVERLAEERDSILAERDVLRDHIDNLKVVAVQHQQTEIPALPYGVPHPPLSDQTIPGTLDLESLTNKIIIAHQFFTQLIQTPQTIGLLFSADELSTVETTFTFTSDIDAQIDLLRGPMLSESDKALLAQPEMHMEAVSFIYLRLLPLIQKAHSCEVELHRVKMLLASMTIEYEHRLEEMNGTLLKTVTQVRVMEHQNEHLYRTLAEEKACTDVIQEENIRLQKILQVCFHNLGVEWSTLAEAEGSWRYTQNALACMTQLTKQLSLGEEYHSPSKLLNFLSASSHHIHTMQTNTSHLETLNKKYLSETWSLQQRMHTMYWALTHKDAELIQLRQQSQHWTSENTDLRRKLSYWKDRAKQWQSSELAQRHCEADLGDTEAAGKPTL